MKKKTVGMITIYRKNYGAFLQAYALQQSLIKCGYAPELIRYDYYRDRSIMEVPLSLLKTPILFAKKLVVATIRHHANDARQAIFDQSIKTHLLESAQYYKNYSSLEKDPPHYDVYLTGSDQVFNPRLTPHAQKSRLLCFADGIKASYAASAGNVIFTEEEKCFLKKELGKFSRVSVREQKLKDYIKKEFAIESDCHIDPTFLLSKEEWAAFGVKPRELQGPYIFYYQVAENNGLSDAAESISQQLNVPVYAGDGYLEFKNQIKRERPLSPEEWVGAINDATYVVTNSFHGTAFSVNLHKRVRVVLPVQGKERITNLLDCSNLQCLVEKRILEAGEIEDLYEESDRYLSIEQTKALDYLGAL